MVNGSVVGMAGLLWEACLVYIDDVIIMGNDFQSHLCNIAAVLSCLWDGGLKVKSLKCHFVRKSSFSCSLVTPLPGRERGRVRRHCYSKCVLSAEKGVRQSGVVIKGGMGNGETRNEKWENTEMKRKITKGQRKWQVSIPSMIHVILPMNLW